jgi:hypothetical protein
MEVVISFDDTGSMSSVRAQVRQKISQLVKHLLELDPLTKIGIIIHLDYCDRDIISHLDLTNDEGLLTKFINSKLDGYGGDADECYELALNYIHSKFSWGSDKKLAILIGDCEPHEVGYKYGSFKNKMDWKQELQTCISSGIRVYPIQALNNRSANYFYNEIAKVSGVPKLDLSQFAHINQFITAVMANENGNLEDYENSNPEFKTNASLKRMFDKLKGLTVSEEPEYYSSSSSSRAVRAPKDYGTGDGTATIDLASKFQVLEVGTIPRVIKEFVEDNGAKFKTGRGFYQFILTETIQENKEVLFVDKLTGEVKSDTVWCRNQIGVPFGTRGRVTPKKLECSKQYDMFIQSTSHNRKLDPNTKFLYELDYK